MSDRSIIVSFFSPLSHHIAQAALRLYRSLAEPGLNAWRSG
jgi:hypothetical protein